MGKAMSKEITIIEQKTVEFQGDRLTAVLAADGEVYVPIRPLCEELETLGKKLAAPDLYSDPSQKDELSLLARREGALRKELRDLEAEWLTASEALEQAELAQSEPG